MPNIDEVLHRFHTLPQVRSVTSRTVTHVHIEVEYFGDDESRCEIYRMEDEIRAALPDIALDFTVSQSKYR